jgi:hypothetical protein
MHWPSWQMQQVIPIDLPACSELPWAAEVFFRSVANSKTGVAVSFAGDLSGRALVLVLQVDRSCCSKAYPFEQRMKH